jgi:hypothetical protein
VVLFAPLPAIQNLSTALVYVPMGGMSSQPHSTCMNDHIFLCPRGLCRPYFALTELWDSPQCVEARTGLSPLPHAIPVNLAYLFAQRSGGGGGLRPQLEPPSRPFMMPRLPFEAIDIEWFFYARYNEAPAPVVIQNGSEPATCGLIRELPIYYAICRSARITCGDQLLNWWRDSALVALRPTTKAMLAECEALNTRFCSSGSCV